ncbi:hypothetical protein EDF35_1951 [Rathayibacter sp. PhB151]|uniref:hypothetical protein n=1 Tax=Rathayibacter sp. PhB151 TaxID=2485189 RepID=UPI001062FF37|nr:hypothetical protein [Rathayibacter sp. PhB151]TDX78737.1 hypothetical protein EDF35_1951 [Rathayibacter sp. PhB151]
MDGPIVVTRDRLPFVNGGDLGLVPDDASAAAKNTEILRELFRGDHGKYVLLPPGKYWHKGLLSIDGTDMTIWAYGVTLWLTDMARVHNVTSSTTIDHGDLTIMGLRIYGNDENQGDEAADGNNYDRSKGMLLMRGRRLTLIDVTVEHTRGHGVNYFGWDYVFVRSYRVMQMKNPVSTAGARRRDGITGAAKHVDIDGVSGYTADDLVAVGVGIRWSPLGATGAVNAATVNIRGVSAQVCDTDSEVKAWRGVALYAMNGYTFDSVSISNVTGQTKSGHVMLKCYADAGDTGAGVNTGYIKSITLAGVSGSSWSFSEFETFLSISQMTIDSITIDGVSRRAPATSYGGSTPVPAYPTLLIRNGARVKTLMLKNVSCVSEDTGAGRAMDLVHIRDDATTVERIITDAGSLSLTQPYANTPGALFLLRKTSASSAATEVTGIGRDQTAIENAAVVISGAARGAGADANQLTSTGVYQGDGTGANWPVVTVGNPQLMLVSRGADNTVLQWVLRNREDLSRTYVRARDASGNWTDWLRSANPDVGTWRTGVSQVGAAISPETLANVIKYVTGYQVAGVAGDGVDANQLIRAGVFATKTAPSPNWPYTSGSMQMTVSPFPTGEILQTVVRLSSGNQSILSFRTYNGTAWSAWTSLNAFDEATWRTGVSTLASMLSPATLAALMAPLGGGWGARPKGPAAVLYQKFSCTNLTPPRDITLYVKGAAVDGSGDTWRDGAGTIITNSGQ